MGLNNEYGGDLVQPDEYQDDDYEDDHDLELAPEDWHDWNSEHVLNMWMSLQQYLEDNHVSSILLNHATFHKFAEFVRTHSS